MCGAVRAHGGAFGRRTSQWTTAFNRNSGTYIVYNSHVTFRNSSFSLTMVMFTSHFFGFHWLWGYFPICCWPKPGSVGVRICHYHRIQRRPLCGDFPISSTGYTFFQLHNCGHGNISAITLLILSLRGYDPVNILWYTAPVDIMTFRWSHRSYQYICQQHPPYSHPQVTLIYYSTSSTLILLLLLILHAALLGYYNASNSAGRVLDAGKFRYHNSYASLHLVFSKINLFSEKITKNLIFHMYPIQTATRNSTITLYSKASKFCYIAIGYASFMINYHVLWTKLSVSLPNL